MTRSLKPEEMKTDGIARSWSAILQYIFSKTFSVVVGQDRVRKFMAETKGYYEKASSWSHTFSQTFCCSTCVNVGVTEELGKGTIVQARTWSYLPNDVLCEIFSRLCPRDRVVFQSISKSWYTIGVIMTQRYADIECSMFPYLMLSNSRIFHPICEKCNHMGFPDISVALALSGPSYGKFHHMDFLDQPGAVVRVAKDGWMLMICFTKLFFFNPFTKEKVLLPDIGHFPKSMYFSSPPTSDNWFVVAATNLGIRTIKCGDNNWSCCELNINDDSFNFSHCNAVVLKGLYYFLGKHARLLIHDPKTRKFYIHKSPLSIQLTASAGEQYMFVTDGKLLAVIEGFFGSSIFVYQWNLATEMWETLETLDDKVVFVSHPQSLCTRSPLKDICNKIYFPRLVGSHCLFYSLATKSLHTHTFTMDTLYRNFGESKEYLGATWMT